MRSLAESTNEPAPELGTCSLCLSVVEAGGWTVVERAIAELRSFERAEAPRLGPGICGACADAIRRLRSRDVDAIAA